MAKIWQRHKCPSKVIWIKEMWYIHIVVCYSGEGNGTPLQYSCLENPIDGGAWWAAVHGVAKSRTRLSDFTFTFHFHTLEKEMATHSSVLAWRIPGTGEPGGLLSMESHRVGHDWSDLAAPAEAGCYSALRKKEILQNWTRLINPEDIMLSEISQSQKDKHWMIPLYRYLKYSNL